MPGVHRGVQAVRRGLAVEEPAAPLGQRVAQGEGVDSTRSVVAEGHDRGIGGAPHGDAGRGADGGPQRRSRRPGVGGQTEVAVLAEVVEDGPTGGDGAARPGAGHGRRPVEAAQPVGGDERLQAGQVGIAVEDDRHPLGRVSVLVEVGADGRHPGDGQVPGFGDVAERAEEGEDEPAQAGVDVAEDAPLGGQRRQVGDRVDHALRIRRCRADHQNGVVVHGVGHGPDVGAAVGTHRDPAGLDVEVVRRLLECRVRAGGQHHVGSGHVPLGPPPVTGRLGGLEEGLGAPRGEIAPGGAGCRRGGGRPRAGRR